MTLSPVDAPPTTEQGDEGVRPSLIFVGTAQQDPRDGGFNFATPGEPLTFGIPCDTPRMGNFSCGCERSFAGVQSRRATTIAEVAECDDPADFIDTVATSQAEAWGKSHPKDVESAMGLVEEASRFWPGAVVVVRWFWNPDEEFSGFQEFLTLTDYIDEFGLDATAGHAREDDAS